MNDSSPELEAVLQTARDLVGEWRIAEGLQVLDDAAGEFPETVNLEYEKARLVAWKIPREGVMKAREFQERFPNEYLGPALEAHCHVMLHHGKAALKCLAKAKDLGAPESETRALLVAALAMAGQSRTAGKIADDNEDASSVWQHLLASPPQSVEDLEAAMKHFSAVGATLEDVAAYRADWLLSKRRYQECADSLRSALEAIPETDSLQVRLACAEIKMKHWDEAERILHSVLAQRPENVHAMIELLRISLKRGRFVIFFKQFRWAIRLVSERYTTAKKK